MIKRISPLVIFIALGLIVNVFSQDKNARQSDPKRMDEVVVTATKTEETIKEVPNSVIIKDSIDIEDTGAKTVGQLISNEQGIDLRTRGDYGGATEEIHIRGMGAEGTQVLVNGVVVNSPSLGSANLNGLPMNNIERVEVVKGAGSLLYGTSAMGGIINIITKRPEKDITTLNARAGYGTNSTFELSAENGMFITENFGYYLTAGKQETDGFRSNSDLDHKDASLNLVYEKDDLLDVSLYADYVDREMGRPGVKPPAGTTDFYVGAVKLYDSESSNCLIVRVIRICQPHSALKAGHLKMQGSILRPVILIWKTITTIVITVHILLPVFPEARHGSPIMFLPLRPIRKLNLLKR